MLLNEWMNEWMKEGRKERTNERTNEWVNEWTKFCHRLRLPARFAIQSSRELLLTTEIMIRETGSGSLAVLRSALPLRYCATLSALPISSWYTGKGTEMDRGWQRWVARVRFVVRTYQIQMSLLHRHQRSATVLPPSTVPGLDQSSTISSTGRSQVVLFRKELLPRPGCRTPDVGPETVIWYFSASPK